MTAERIFASGPKFVIAAFLFSSPVHAQTALSRCVASDAPVSIDHVVITVHDLAAASNTYRNLGFTLKEGRLHPNGLRNMHIKFQLGGEIELMSVEGETTDEIAGRYAVFLKESEGGAYLALSAPLDAVQITANEIGLTSERTTSGSFAYLTFSDAGLENVFFIEYAQEIEEPDSILQHANGAVGFQEVWLEAGAQLGELLAALNATRCGTNIGPEGTVGNAYRLASGVVVIVPPDPSRNRARVLGVTLESPLGGLAVPSADAHGIRLEIRKADSGNR